MRPDALTRTLVHGIEEDFMPSSLKLLPILGLVALVAACAPPPPEPEPIMVPITEELPPMGKYK